MAGEKIKAIKKLGLFLRGSKKRFNYIYGGASSGKSWGIALHLLVEKAAKEPGCGILCIRQTKPAVKASCLRLVKSYLEKLGWDYFENKTENWIRLINGSIFYFDGLDDVEKIKSVEGINYIWIEEATEITFKEWLQLNLRCRAHNKHGINQLFLSFNPVDPVGNEWLKNLVDEVGDDSCVFKMTYIDNPFLAEEERQQIRNLADMDEEYDKIYRKGEWATPSHIIYTNWDIVDDFNEYCENVGYGLDFGFKMPTALIMIGEREEQRWADEILYETHLTNSQLIERMKLEIPEECRDRAIMADCAEPDRIQEIGDAGFNIWPCIKGQGSVGVGIDRVKRKKLHITRRSENIIKEIRGYKYKVDKTGNVLDTPVEFRDHAMDAIRYYAGQCDEGDMEVVEVGNLLS